MTRRNGSASSYGTGRKDTGRTTNWPSPAAEKRQQVPVTDKSLLVLISIPVLVHQLLVQIMLNTAMMLEMEISLKVTENS